MSATLELARIGFDPGRLPALQVMTSVDAATLMAARGWEITQSAGLHWRSQRHRRFWTPIDSMRQLPAGSVLPPAGPRLGYLAAVDAGGNTALTAALMPDLDRLSLFVQPTAKRRYEVGRSLRRNRFSFDGQRVLDSGFAVMQETHQRAGHRLAPDIRAFREEISAFLSLPGGLIVATHKDRDLTGYLTAHVQGQTLYLDDVCITAAGLRDRCGTGLYWLALVAGSQVPQVRQAHLGPWFPENSSLHYYKRSLGAKLVTLPAQGRLNRVVGALLRARRPAAYVRLGGSDPQVRTAQGIPSPGTYGELPGSNESRSPAPSAIGPAPSSDAASS